MSNFKGHFFFSIFIGLSFYCIISVIFSFTEFSKYFIVNDIKYAIIQLSLIIFFSLFPDIDIKSKFQVIFYFIVFLIDGFLILKRKYNVASYIGFFSMIPVFSRHRGWTHSIIAALIFPAVVFFMPQIYPENNNFPLYFSGLIGYLSHLIVDKF